MVPASRAPGTFHDDRPSLQAVGQRRRILAPQALRQLCAEFRSGAAPFFFSEIMTDPSPLVRETCAQLLGDNPALASLRETPLWLVGFAADSGPNVRSAAIRALGKVDRDLRFPPALGVVFLAALTECDPETKAAARSVLDPALRHNLASQDSDRQRVAFELLRRVDVETVTRIALVLVLGYNRLSTATAVFAAHGAMANSRPPLIPKATPRPQVPLAATTTLNSTGIDQ